MYKLLQCGLLIVFALTIQIADAATTERIVMSPYVAAEKMGSPAIRDIFQDSRGYIWVSTREGLTKFDGHRATAISQDLNDPGSLSSASVTGVVEDSSGVIWVATGGGGLNRYDPSTGMITALHTGGEPSQSPLSDNIRTIKFGRGDVIWLGYKYGGLSAFYPRQGVFKHYKPDFYEALSADPVIGVAEIADGSLLVATDGGGVAKLDTRTNVMRRFVGKHRHAQHKTPTDVFSAIQVYGESIFLGTTNYGVYEISGDTIQPVLEDWLPSRDIQHIYADSVGSLWISTVSGLVQYTPESQEVRVYTLENSKLPHARVEVTYEDHTGLLWFGTYYGISVGYRSQFRVITKADGLSAGTVLSIAETPDETLWIGTSAGLYRRFADDPIVAKTDMVGIVDLSEAVIMNLMSHGIYLYIGTFSRGLFIYNTKSGDVIHRDHDPSNQYSLSTNAISGTQIDAQGMLWVATMGGGLHLGDSAGKRFIRLQHDPSDETSLSSNNIFTVYVDRAGEVWAGTDLGLNRYSPETHSFDRFIHQPSQYGGLASNRILSLYEDTESVLWIGTQGGGLHSWAARERKTSLPVMAHYKSNIELPSGSVYSILGSEDGQIWLGTTAGLSSLDPQDASYRHYDEIHGLQSSDFSLGAAFKSSSGDLYFGGPKGITSFSDKDIKTEAAHNFPLQITEIERIKDEKLIKERYAENSSLDMEYLDNYLSIDFSAMQHFEPERVRYRYQFVGGGRGGWRDLGSDHNLTLAGLPVGKFQLAIQSSLGEGDWADQVSIPVIRHPAPWLSPFAYTAYGTLALLFLFTLVYRVQMSRKQSERSRASLEATVAARTRALESAKAEAEAANRAKSDFLATVSHEIRTPMSAVMGSMESLQLSTLTTKQQELAGRASRQGQRLLNLLNEILDFSKLESGKVEIEAKAFDLEEFCEDACLIHADQAFSTGLEFNYIYGLTSSKLRIGDPEKIGQIAHNLLSNAIKFTHEGEVTVAITELPDSDLVELSVTDTGIGISQNKIARILERFTQADASTTRRYGGTGLGLSIVKQLATLMGGELSIESKSNEGSCFSVVLPLPEATDDSPTLRVEAFSALDAWILSTSRSAQRMFNSAFSSLGVKASTVQTLDDIAPNPGRKSVLLLDAASLNDQELLTLKQIATNTDISIIVASPEGDYGSTLEIAAIVSIESPVTRRRLALGLAQSLNIPAISIGLLGSEQEDGDELYALDAVILSVDDQQINHDVLTPVLEYFGCSVFTADNGYEALSMIQEREFDVVIMDCQMPVMDGFQTTEAIRAYESARGLRRVPVLAYTAGTENVKARCLESGMDNMIIKGAGHASINAMLSQYLTPLGTLEKVGSKKEEKASDATSEEILNLTALKELQTIEQSSGKPLIGSVVASYSEDVTTLFELLSNCTDPVEAHKSAHAIKSSSLNLGAQIVVILAGDMERSARDDDSLPGVEKIARLGEEIENAKQALLLFAENSAISE
jgi:signal transduction histidine kinase/ligand-binding sensor domain-containing protein/CheY-like chemotaxis protein